MTSSPLALKLQLLSTLQSGNIESIHSLVSRIKEVTKINPQLYSKFNQFIQQNKQGLIDMEKQDQEENEEPQPVIENVEGDVEEQYNSEDSWSATSSEEQEQEVPKDTKPATNVISNKQNSKQCPSQKASKVPVTNPAVAFKKTNLTTTQISTPSQSKILKPRN